MVAWNKALVSTWSQFVVDSLGGQIVFTLIIIGCTTLMAMLMAFVPIRWRTPHTCTPDRPTFGRAKDQTFRFALCVSFSVMRISSKGVTRDRVLRLTRIVGFFNSNMSWLIAMALAKLAQSVISTANVRARAPQCAARIDRSIRYGSMQNCAVAASLYWAVAGAVLLMITLVLALLRHTAQCARACVRVARLAKPTTLARHSTVTVAVQAMGLGSVRARARGQPCRLAARPIDQSDLPDSAGESRAAGGGY